MVFTHETTITIAVAITIIGRSSFWSISIIHVILGIILMIQVQIIILFLIF